MILLTLGYLKYSSKTFLCITVIVLMHLFLYMFTLYFIAIRQWDQTLRERNEYKGALEKVIKKKDKYYVNL